MSVEIWFEDEGDSRLKNQDSRPSQHVPAVVKLSIRAGVMATVVFTETFSLLTYFI